MNRDERREAGREHVEYACHDGKCLRVRLTAVGMRFEIIDAQGHKTVARMPMESAERLLDRIQWVMNQWDACQDAFDAVEGPAQ